MVEHTKKIISKYRYYFILYIALIIILFFLKNIFIDVFWISFFTILAIPTAHIIVGYLGRKEDFDNSNPKLVLWLGLISTFIGFSLAITAQEIQEDIATKKRLLGILEAAYISTDSSLGNVLTLHNLGFVTIIDNRDILPNFLSYHHVEIPVNSIIESGELFPLLSTEMKSEMFQWGTNIEVLPSSLRYQTTDSILMNRENLKDDVNRKNSENEGTNNSTDMVDANVDSYLEKQYLKNFLSLELYALNLMYKKSYLTLEILYQKGDVSKELYMKESKHIQAESLNREFAIIRYNVPMLSLKDYLNDDRFIYSKGGGNIDKQSNIEGTEFVGFLGEVKFRKPNHLFSASFVKSYSTRLEFLEQ